MFVSLQGSCMTKDKIAKKGIVYSRRGTVPENYRKRCCQSESAAFDIVPMVIQPGSISAPEVNIPNNAGYMGLYEYIDLQGDREMKKLLSILLICAMVVTLLPAAAFAENENTQIGGGDCEKHK